MDSSSGSMSPAKPYACESSDHLMPLSEDRLTSNG
jgi:hypothetical protein